MFDWPAFDGLLEVLVIDGTNCGSALITVSTLAEPDCWNSCWLTETTGLADS